MSEMAREEAEGERGREKTCFRPGAAASCAQFQLNESRGNDERTRRVQCAQAAAAAEPQRATGARAI